MTDTPRKPRGFQTMTPEQRSAISRKGGASVKPENRSFARDPGLAATAGAKGGSISRRGKK